MSHTDRWSGGVSFVFALAVLYGASRMPLGNVANPGPGFFPFWGAVFLGLLSLLLILRPAAPVDSGIPPVPFGGAARMIVALCVYALVFELLGYVLATIGLLIVVLREYRQPLTISLGVAIGAPVATYYLFAKALGLALPIGLLPI